MSGQKAGPWLGISDAQNRTESMRAELEEMENNMPLLIRLQEAVATITRAKFLSLVEKGFSAPQAIELCKAPR